MYLRVYFSAGANLAFGLVYRPLPARLGASVLLLGLTGPPVQIFMAFAAS